MLERVEFKPNTPVEVAFAFPDGKQIPGRFGPSVMFTTSDNRVAFLPPIAAERIKALGVSPGQPVRITKAGTGSKTEWQVARVAGEQPDGTFAIPKEQPAPRMASDAAPETPAQPMKSPVVNGHGTNFHGSQGRYIAPLPDSSPIADRLRSTVNMLVDVQGDCLEHAKKYNGGVRPEDVRAILLTAYIGMSKGMR